LLSPQTFENDESFLRLSAASCFFFGFDEAFLAGFLAALPLVTFCAFDASDAFFAAGGFRLRAGVRDSANP